MFRFEVVVGNGLKISKSSLMKSPIFDNIEVHNKLIVTCTQLNDFTCYHR